MTREEQLKQEAEEYQIKLRESFTPLEQICWGNIYKAYIAGAEPREKRIEELEKKNKELEETLKTYNGCGDWDTDFHACRVYLQHEELQDLQEENVELKEQNRNYEQLIENGSVTLVKERLKNYKRLTKAKEIINKLIELVEFLNEDNVKEPIIAKAEQFLQEIEK